jgi:hypothetical protein
MTCIVSEKMWGKKSIHIPNVTDVYGSDLVGSFVDNYQTRVLCLLGNKQKILLPERHREATLNLLRYLIKIGFTHLSEENIIFINDYGNKSFEIGSLALSVGDSISELSNADYSQVVPFFSSATVELLVHKYKKSTHLSHALACLLNDKGHLRDILVKEGIQVTGSNKVSIFQPNYLERCLDIYEKLKNTGVKEFAVIIPKSCSGAGIHRFSNASDLLNIISQLTNVEEFLIDPWYGDNIGSPSYQIYIADDPKDDICIGLTDQMLDDCVHLGNLYPSIFKAEKAIDDIFYRVVEVLRERGAHGVLGVDLLIRKVHGKIVPYVLEVNARQTGAVYAGFLAYDLRNGKRKPWIGHNNIVLPPGTSLDSYHKYLIEHNVDFKKGDSEGVMITCNGNLPHNKIMVLIMADTTERLYELLDIAENIQ